MEGYEFDIEKVMGGRVDRSLQEPKRSINDEESMFPRLIEDQGNLAMQVCDLPLFLVKFL
jgi:hypothetical protein